MSEITNQTSGRCCAKCGAPIHECMGFNLARDHLDPTVAVPRELCGKCIIGWSTKVVGGELVDTTEEERAAFIDALPPPQRLPGTVHV